MLKIAIIGTGNVGFHLAKRLKTSGNEPVAIVSREPTRAQSLVKELKISSQVLKLEEIHLLLCDLIILAVPDQVITQVINTNTFPSNTIVVHTSGSQSMALLDRLNYHGVFYPFQTFTKGKEIDFENVPIYIEANTTETLSQLLKMSEHFSSHVKSINSEQRLKIHLAAVFASNFSNHLYFIAETILKEVDVQLLDFQHLMNETTQKALTLSPQTAQTGPAARGDHSIIEKHLLLLENQPEWQKLYQLISEQISTLQKT